MTIDEFYEPITKEWAAIFERRIVSRLSDLGTRDTGALINSVFRFQQISEGGVVAGVNFLDYGRYVDWGVGRGRPLKRDGRWTVRPYRQQFYSGIITKEGFKLAWYLAAKSAEAGGEVAVNAFWKGDNIASEL